jgi:hypothetical protein
MNLTTLTKNIEINEVGTYVYLLKDNKLYSGQIDAVTITQFNDTNGNPRIGIQYKIGGKLYFNNEVYNDINDVVNHLKSNLQMIA